MILVIFIKILCVPFMLPLCPSGGVNVIGREILGHHFLLPCINLLVVSGGYLMTTKESLH